ncbi:MAG: response regulator [Lachnospiraceae bacterium]|nr:response regulator [Lachnospiraceae bacterium]
MYKIMLADDEGIVIDSLKYIIEKNFGTSCAVEFAKTGRSVIELAENFRPDIAIMDIQMPGINGIDAMKEIKKINSSTIFIVASAYDKFDYAKEAINLGVLDYLNKPIEKDNFVSVLRKAMGIIDKEREKRSNDLMIREKMETVVPIIESGLIYTVLFKENYSEDTENYKTLLGIEQEYGYLMVIECGDGQEGDRLTNAVGAGVKIQSHYLEIREIVKTYCHCVVGAVMANRIIALVPCQSSEMDYNTRIHIIENVREIVHKLRSKTEMEFRIGIGSVKPLLELADSYREALNSMKVSKGSVAHVKDLPIVCEYEKDYPIETEKAIFEYTCKGDVNRVREEANHFFNWMLEKYSSNLIGIKLKTLEFILWSEHLAYESGGMTYHFESRNDYLPTLMAFEDYEELRQWFVNKISEATRNVIAKKYEQSTGVITKAKLFIDTNFQTDLSLDDVSREVDISPYYFSKLFKEETGVNFIEYLTNSRMNKARQLLAETELSMKEVCSEIGYQDPNYFSRIFKKNVGVTPTEFKEGRMK